MNICGMLTVCVGTRKIKPSTLEVLQVVPDQILE